MAELLIGGIAMGTIIGVALLSESKSDDHHTFLNNFTKLNNTLYTNNSSDFIKNIEKHEVFYRFLNSNTPHTIFKQTVQDIVIRLPTFAEKRNVAIQAYRAIVKAYKNRNQINNFSIPSGPTPTDPTFLTKLAEISTKKETFYFKHRDFIYTHNFITVLPSGMASIENIYVINLRGFPKLSLKDIDNSNIVKYNYF